VRVGVSAHFVHWLAIRRQHEDIVSERDCRAGGAGLRSHEGGGKIDARSAEAVYRSERTCARSAAPTLAAAITDPDDAQT